MYRATQSLNLKITKTQQQLEHNIIHYNLETDGSLPETVHFLSQAALLLLSRVGVQRVVVFAVSLDGLDMLSRFREIHRWLVISPRKFPQHWSRSLFRILTR